MRLFPRYLRICLSAALAVALCLAQNYADELRRSTVNWSNVLRHPSGRFMLLCAVWALIEIALALMMPRSKDSVLQPYVLVLISYTVAAVSAAICIAQDHVHFAVRNPATWVNILQHRCGRLMLICTVWALVEIAIVMVQPRERELSFQPLTAC